MKKGDKRGSHVGMIASFAIFILFLVAMYSVFEPALRTQKDKQNIVNYLENALINEFSGNLTTVAISPYSGNCSQIDNSELGFLGLNAVVRDKNAVIGSELRGQDLIVEATSENIAWIYYANVSFVNTATAETGCTTAEIKSITTTEEIYEEKILYGINNFQNLKDSLNVPPGSEYGFSFLMNNGTEFKANDIQASQDVYSKEILIQYINSNAEKLSGKIILKTW
ncbi:MAG: hypothetical protein AABW50_04600 [Nanoarchaeota archaeon]